MISPVVSKDLIVLSADKSIKLVTDRLLARSDHLGFRKISADVFVHPERDPGILGQSYAFLRDYLRQYHYAITICDREGCGSDSSREELEMQIERLLRINGWDDRAAAIVIDPELEIWLWANWNALSECVGWRGYAVSLRDWLTAQKLLGAAQTKPARPKEVLTRVLKETRKPQSSAIFAAVAESADTSECVDAAFLKLKSNFNFGFPSNANPRGVVPTCSDPNQNGCALRAHCRISRTAAADHPHQCSPGVGPRNRHRPQGQLH